MERTIKDITDIVNKWGQCSSEGAIYWDNNTDFQNPELGNGDPQVLMAEEIIKYFKK